MQEIAHRPQNYHPDDVPAGLDPIRHRIILTHFFGLDPVDFDSPRYSRRCDVVYFELRRSWWRLHRQGVVLPAEAGVISIEGGTL